MKIGIFDSGLGGLVIVKALRKAMPKYDYIYLGDTKNLPYGNKTQKQIYNFSVKAIEHLFKQDCELVVVACNTVSSEALRKLQQEYLPKSKYIDRKILGIIIPTVESVKNEKTVAVIGTNRTIDSKAYLREFKKYHPKTKVLQLNTPLLAPMIEAHNFSDINPVFKHYWQKFENKNVNTLVLGCTHYGLIKSLIRKLLPKNISVIAQEDLLPGKLSTYLNNHPEISKKLTKNAKLELLVTKNNALYTDLTKDWFGKSVKLKEIKL